jgi:hypothetical protein
VNDIDLTELTSTRQARVDAAPADVYRLVSDVPRWPLEPERERRRVR